MPDRLSIAALPDEIRLAICPELLCGHVFNPMSGHCPLHPGRAHDVLVCQVIRRLTPQQALDERRTEQNRQHMLDALKEHGAVRIYRKNGAARLANDLAVEGLVTLEIKPDGSQGSYMLVKPIEGAF